MKSWDELSEVEQLACMFSDFYKDVHGVRPRFDDASWTVADYQREIDGLRDYSEILEKEQKEFEERKIQEVEERIAKLIAIGAGDRATAIRWIRDAEDCNGSDEDYLCFVLGIPYGYFKEAA